MIIKVANHGHFHQILNWDQIDETGLLYAKQGTHETETTNQRGCSHRKGDLASGESGMPRACPGGASGAGCGTEPPHHHDLRRRPASAGARRHRREPCGKRDEGNIKTMRITMERGGRTNCFTGSSSDYIAPVTKGLVYGTTWPTDGSNE